MLDHCWNSVIDDDTTFNHDCHERDVAQWLEHSALQLAVACSASSRLASGGFSEKYHVSSLSTVGHCGINVVSLGKALYPQAFHFTQV